MKHGPNSLAAKRIARNRPARTAIDLLQEGLRQSAVHVNIGQHMIITTEDRLRLDLNELSDSTKRRQQWHAPSGMLITELAALVAANFHDAIGISGQQWENFFLILIFGTMFWLLVALISGRRASSPDSLIEKLKAGQPPFDRSTTKGVHGKS